MTKEEIVTRLIAASMSDHERWTWLCYGEDSMTAVYRYFSDWADTIIRESREGDCDRIKASGPNMIELSDKDKEVEIVAKKIKTKKIKKKGV